MAAAAAAMRTPRGAARRCGGARMSRKCQWLDGYHGCLRVDVQRSCVLYRKIEGWASAVTKAAAATD
jgi:hypothetical protein